MDHLRLFAVIGFLLAFSSVMPGKAMAQNPYFSSAGLRLGYPSAISYKQFFGNDTPLAFEAYIGTQGYTRYYRTSSISIALLYHEDLGRLLEKLDVPYVENLFCYIGGGITGYSWRYTGNPLNDPYGDFSWGVDLYVGSEYTFEDIPLVVGIDWSPRIFWGRAYYRGVGLGYGTLSVRYILK